MRDSTRKGLIIGVVVAAAVILISGTLLIGGFFFGWDRDVGAVSFRERAGRFFGLFTDAY